MPFIARDPQRRSRNHRGRRRRDRRRSCRWRQLPAGARVARPRRIRRRRPRARHDERPAPVGAGRVRLGRPRTSRQTERTALERERRPDFVEGQQFYAVTPGRFLREGEGVRHAVAHARRHAGEAASSRNRKPTRRGRSRREDRSAKWTAVTASPSRRPQAGRPKSSPLPRRKLRSRWPPRRDSADWRRRRNRLKGRNPESPTASRVGRAALRTRPSPNSAHKQSAPDCDEGATVLSSVRRRDWTVLRPLFPLEARTESVPLPPFRSRRRRLAPFSISGRQAPRPVRRGRWLRLAATK